jgi:lipopolysaccharide biosynthesis glycosyltransferase
VLYLDTDTLLLTDVSKLWAEFGRFEKGRHAIGVVSDEQCCHRCVGWRRGVVEVNGRQHACRG